MLDYEKIELETKLSADIEEAFKVFGIPKTQIFHAQRDRLILWFTE